MDSDTTHHAKRTFEVTDLRRDCFPTTEYRFSLVLPTARDVTLMRDFLGENPLHYVMDVPKHELVVASNIADLKQHLDQRFSWERVRAVSNNTRVRIDQEAFNTASPREEEIQPTLPEMPYAIPGPAEAGIGTRWLLEEAVANRLDIIGDDRIGLLLSGGLDSMSIGYFLAREMQDRELVAFTLKTADDSHDVAKSRFIAQALGILLVEVKVNLDHGQLSLQAQRYDTKRRLAHSYDIPVGALSTTMDEVLRVSNNPKRDNLFCSFAMYLAAKAVKAEGISTVFCGEGPNEMLNDYGLDPTASGYAPGKDNIRFREALTFGAKKTDRQLGRGGLAKHALCRMGKMFGHEEIRLESPYFDARIARLLTAVPHEPGYDTVKQRIVGAMLEGEGLDAFIKGTEKEKFQDGSGISPLLAGFDQQVLTERFERIYGVRKSYL